MTISPGALKKVTSPNPWSVMGEVNSTPRDCSSATVAPMLSQKNEMAWVLGWACDAS